MPFDFQDRCLKPLGHPSGAAVTRETFREFQPPKLNNCAAYRAGASCFAYSGGTQRRRQAAANQSSQ
jgi:hypothetical protein